MKLAQVTNFFDEHLGGLEVVAARLAKEWSADGVTIEWLAAGTKPLATTDAPAGAFRVKKISLRAWNGIERRMGLPYPVIGPRGMAAIWRAVRAADAVVLHDTLYMSNIFAAIAGRLLRKPVLVIQHIGAVPYTSAVLRGLMAVANRMIARPVLKSASQVVFISRLAADFFANVPLRRPARFVFNGVDTAVFRPSADPQAKAQLRTALGLPRNAPVALFVGRFVEKKGITVLVRLAARMPHVTWVFAGQGVLDPQKQNLPNARVFHSLNHSELVKLYQCADVLVLPSVGEGLPLEF